MSKKSEAIPLARKYFGLQLQDLTAKLSESLGIEEGAGALVADVDAKSPAEVAGVKGGLVIYQVGRYAISSVQEVEGLLEMIGSGSAVDFTFGVVRKIRGQAVRQLQTVSLTAR